MSNVTEEVIALEREFWTRGGDNAFMDRAMADGAIAVVEPIGIIPKEQSMEMNSQAKPFKQVEMLDISVREMSPEVVILAYHGRGVNGANNEPYQGSICSTYVKKDGKWQLALTAHQPWKPEAKKKAS